MANEVSFVGVVSGLIAFGLIGIFVVPVVLAVAHKLLSAWVAEEIEEGGGLADEGAS